MGLERHMKEDVYCSADVQADLHMLMIGVQNPWV